MKVRADIADMLRDGLTDTQIAARAHVGHRTAAAARRALKLPKCRAGNKPQQSLEQALRDRSQVTDDGHWIWTGSRDRGFPIFRYCGDRYTAHRAAFIVRHGRTPIGTVTPGCEHPDCIAPDHVEDRPMRERYRATYVAVFGRAP